MRSKRLIERIRGLTPENLALGPLCSRPCAVPENRNDFADQTQRAARETDRLIGKVMPAYESGKLYLTVVVNHLLKIVYDASRRFETVADTESDA